MRRDFLVALLLFALALGQNLSRVDSTGFHRDEARWIHRAHYLRELADPLGPTWRDRELTRGQPPLGSYLMALGLVLQGRDLTTNGLWNFHFGESWNIRHGRMPVQADLDAARRTDSVVGALIVVVVYFIGKRLANRLAGAVAALVLIPHPLSIYLSSLANSDSLLTLLVALAALVAAGLADRPSWWRAVLLGVLLGLGGATKLSPLFVALPLAGLGLVLLGWAWLRRRRGDPSATPAPALAWQLLSVPVVAAVTFVAAYPYLWPDPVGRTITLFEFRAREMQNQGEIWENIAVTSRVDAIGRIGFWLGDARSTTGWLASRLANIFGIDWHPAGIDLPLALIGALILVGLAVRHGATSRHVLVAIVLGGQVAVIVGGMRADFERYMLPVLVAVAVCIGLTAAEAWPRARRLVDRVRTAGGLLPALGLASGGAPRPARRVVAGARPLPGATAGGASLRARAVGSGTLGPPRRHRSPRVRPPRAAPNGLTATAPAPSSCPEGTRPAADPARLRSDATA